MFLGDLARELKMSVAEIANGRGALMPAYELGVFWPTYYRFYNQEQRKIAQEQDKDRGR